MKLSLHFAIAGWWSLAALPHVMGIELTAARRLLRLAEETDIVRYKFRSRVEFMN